MDGRCNSSSCMNRTDKKKIHMTKQAHTASMSTIVSLLCVPQIELMRLTIRIRLLQNSLGDQQFNTVWGFREHSLSSAYQTKRRGITDSCGAGNDAPLLLEDSGVVPLGSVFCRGEPSISRRILARTLFMAHNTAFPFGIHVQYNNHECIRHFIAAAGKHS